MQTVAEYLAALDEAPEETEEKPVASQWLFVDLLKLVSGRLWVGDAQFALYESDGVVVELPAATYTVECKMLSYFGDHRVSHLRVRPKGTNLMRGEKIGETWADTASQAVCDFELYQDAEGADYEDIFWAAYDHWDYQTRVDLGGDASLIVVSSGFGDGSFPLYELLDGELRCGIEVEMINQDGIHKSWGI